MEEGKRKLKGQLKEELSFHSNPQSSQGLGVLGGPLPEQKEGNIS